MNKMILLMLMVAVVLLPASTIQFISAGPQNNGVEYVGPYSLTIDGIPVLADCVSPSLPVAPPYTWQADLVPIVDYTGSAETTLLEQQWLNTQFAVNSDWVGIQQAIWYLSGADYSDSDTLGWIALAQANYGSVNTAAVTVIVPIDPD
jgi:hypothetical protein